jgi:hypothetical protein
LNWRTRCGWSPWLCQIRCTELTRQFVTKLRDIVGLGACPRAGHRPDPWVDPPGHAVVLSVDEKSQIQALDRTQPGLTMKEGRRATMTMTTSATARPLCSPRSTSWKARSSAVAWVDGDLEIDARAKDPAFEASLGRFGEEALDRIEPRGRDRGVMEDKARMPVEPGANLGVLVCPVIIEDVDNLAGRDVGFDRIEEANELLMAVTLAS